jgi:hypothetical protein
MKRIYPKNWKEISFRIKSISHFTCCLCFKASSRHNPLTVHHFDHDTLNNDDSNLVCLCARCHLLLHSAMTGIRSHSDLRYFIDFRNKDLRLTTL